MVTASIEHSRWVSKMIARKERITMPSFANAFGYTSEQDAHSAFSKLISSTNIPQARHQHNTEDNRGEVVSGSQQVAKNLIWEESNNLVQSHVDTQRDGSSDSFSAMGLEDASSSSVTGSVLAMPSTMTAPNCLRQESQDHATFLSHKTLPEASSSPAPFPVVSLVDYYGLLASGHSTAQDPVQSKRASFGRNLTLDDISSHQGSPSKADDGNCPSDVTPPIYYPRCSLGSNLLSDDPAVSSFVDQDDPAQSTTRLYSWNFLDGRGRVDSNVDSYWVCNGTAIGAELMRFRRWTVENNGGFTKARQKLAVDFIFLVEEEYRTDDQQGQVNNEIWDALCDAVRDHVQPLPKTVVNDVHEWAHRMANNKMGAFEQMLEESPPVDRNLNAILTKMTNNSQFWSTQARNEDTYLKSQLGPFLDTYFGKLRYSTSDWTPTQDDTMDPESSTLIPDYGTAAPIGEQRYFVLLLEGKIAGNAGQCQMWTT
ncbi:hypothetical protein BGX24_000390 [Mortierella sp. AD032]|nr:hypothetical protein BGX24_000390 [Mortierella sp. AD032]